MSDFPRQLAHAWPPPEWADLGIVVAVSGGADSVALLRGLATIRRPGPGRMLIAHFNHRLRGDASTRDEAFVRELAESLALPIQVGHWSDRPTAAENDSIDDGNSDNDSESHDNPCDEASARQARYRFLLDVAHQHGARFVATAHTADDQAETVLHHVLRGTGLAGLAGIPRVRRLSEAVTLIRPMLDVSRADVEHFLKEIGQAYCHDATNDTSHYTRNRIRQEVMPQLSAAFNPRLGEALRNLARSAAGAREVINRAADALTERAVTFDGDVVVLQVAAFADEPSYLIRETLIAVWRRQQWPRQAMRHEHWNRLAGMVAASSDITAVDFPGNVHARRESDRLTITRLA
ncbi:MAG: tRNA lysidine(34) synthetase TilS [Pirellulales bacterium]